VRRTLGVAMLVALSAYVSLARPQKGHESWFKVIGRVLDGNGRPIKWGRVYVKDVHAHFLRIKLVDRDGRFSLGWLDARLDYEVYAEQDDLVSEKILISGSQRPAEMSIALKLGKQQENH
jgi:predicted transcriptional regulator